MTIISFFTGISGCGGNSNAPTPKLSPEPVDVVIPEPELPVVIAVAGNSWVGGDPAKSDQMIGDNGLSNWNDSNDQVNTYVYLGQTGKLDIGVKGKVAMGTSKIAITLGSVTKTVELSNTESKSIYVGRFDVDTVGYQKITLTGISSDASNFADISDILIGGKAAEGENYFVKEEFYWGRRGPSVHLGYKLPNSRKDYEWFYGELEVPNGQDVLGTYYMVNGFGEGYFGIQVNSATERRILFSIWSPYQTDDPDSIPEEQRIKLLAKGDDVYSGKFGNEGSGGQSYLRYNWQTDTRYRFLLRVTPADNKKTEYTAYFKTPEDQEWQLIASFSRPETSTYVKRPYSFLENFLPRTGDLERKALYTNQWLRDTDGFWHDLTSATFTYDATAEKKSRLDYQGGVENGMYFLRNDGFFTGNTVKGTTLNRAPGIEPVIDFATIGGTSTIALSDNTEQAVPKLLTGATQQYKLSVPESVSNVTFSIEGSAGNADLYVKKGSEATIDINDCAAANNGSVESCTVTGGGATDYYALIYAIEEVTDLTIKATYVSKLDSSLFTATSESVVQSGHELTNAFDGDFTTFWHTSWAEEALSYPPTVDIDLGDTYNVTALEYTPHEGSGNVSIADYEIYVSDLAADFGEAVASGTWSWSGNSDAKTVTFSAKAGRYLRLVAISETNGKECAAAAEINVFSVAAIDNGSTTGSGEQSKLDNNTLNAFSDSLEQSSHAILNALDGDLDTIWHTAWSSGAPPNYPHNVIIDLNENHAVTAFEYTARNGAGNGTIAGYEIYVSESDTDFGEAVAIGSWEWSSGSLVKKVDFAATTGRYVQLIATSEKNNNTWASAAEFNVYVSD